MSDNLKEERGCNLQFREFSSLPVKRENTNTPIDRVLSRGFNEQLTSICRTSTICFHQSGSQERLWPDLYLLRPYSLSPFQQRWSPEWEILVMEDYVITTVLVQSTYTWLQINIYSRSFVTLQNTKLFNSRKLI